MTNKTKNYILALLAVAFVQLAAGCTAPRPTEPATDATQKPEQLPDATGNNSEVGDEARLTIGGGCIGCGHCLRFDPEHFAPGAGYVPQVISQDNLDSANLQRAMAMCRPGVIKVS